MGVVDEDLHRAVAFQVKVGALLQGGVQVCAGACGVLDEKGAHLGSPFQLDLLHRGGVPAGVRGGLALRLQGFRQGDHPVVGQPVLGRLHLLRGRGGACLRFLGGRLGLHSCGKQQGVASLPGRPALKFRPGAPQAHSRRGQHRQVPNPSGKRSFHKNFPLDIKNLQKSPCAGAAGFSKIKCNTITSSKLEGIVSKKNGNAPETGRRARFWAP